MLLPFSDFLQHHHNCILRQLYAPSDPCTYNTALAGVFNLFVNNNIHTYTHLTAIFPRLPGSAGTRKAKPIWILLKQETVSGSGISWAIYKSAPCSRQITMPAPHHSVFYRLDALPAAQPTASKHWTTLTITPLHTQWYSFAHDDSHYWGYVHYWKRDKPTGRL